MHSTVPWGMRESWLGASICLHHLGRRVRDVRTLVRWDCSTMEWFGMKGA